MIQCMNHAATLTYWDSELDIDAGTLAAFTIERKALTVAAFHSEELRSLSEKAMSLESQLLYVSGGGVGLGGSMVWKEPLLDERYVSPVTPLTIVFGYSRQFEAFAADFSAKQDALKAGVTDCTFWDKKRILFQYKVIALIASQPFLDDVACVRKLEEALQIWESSDGKIPGYAERLGFLRAPVNYETDTPSDLLLMHQLEAFQLDATRKVVGPSPVETLPSFYVLASEAQEQDGDSPEQDLEREK